MSVVDIEDLTRAAWSVVDDGAVVWTPDLLDAPPPSLRARNVGMLASARSGRGDGTFGLRFDTIDVFATPAACRALGLTVLATVCTSAGPSSTCTGPPLPRRATRR